MRLKHVLAVPALFLVASCSNPEEELGRYRIVPGNARDAKAETVPVVLKIDTVTGQTWRYHIETKGSTWVPVDLR